MINSTQMDELERLRAFAREILDVQEGIYPGDDKYWLHACDQDCLASLAVKHGLFVEIAPYDYRISEFMKVPE